jgi:catechol 2,3-dioxygenase-like lactoylglutathione lyase family enzyme
MICVSSLDHWVLTVRDLAATCRFYADILGMEVIQFGEGRLALAFGHQKINLHQVGQEFSPHAQHPTPGSADVCLIVETPLVEVMEFLQQQGIPVELGIVTRTGATGAIASLYLRDPDGNLIELSNPLP